MGKSNDLLHAALHIYIGLPGNGLRHTVYTAHGGNHPDFVPDSRPVVRARKAPERIFLPGGCTLCLRYSLHSGHTLCQGSFLLRSALCLGSFLLRSAASPGNIPCDRHLRHRLIGIFQQVSKTGLQIMGVDPLSRPHGPYDAADCIAVLDHPAALRDILNRHLMPLGNLLQRNNLPDDSLNLCGNTLSRRNGPQRHHNIIVFVYLQEILHNAALMPLSLISLRYPATASVSSFTLFRSRPQKSVLPRKAEANVRASS